MSNSKTSSIATRERFNKPAGDQFEYLIITGFDWGYWGSAVTLEKAVANTCREIRTDSRVKTPATCKVNCFLLPKGKTSWGGDCQIKVDDDKRYYSDWPHCFIEMDVKKGEALELLQYEEESDELVPLK